MKPKAKLSTVWTWADKHLKQVRGNYGDADTKEACALGAIQLYRTHGKKVDDYSDSFGIYNKQISKFEDAYKHKIYILNDRNKWSFKTFAKKAKAIGL